MVRIELATVKWLHWIFCAVFWADSDNLMNYLLCLCSLDWIDTGVIRLPLDTLYRFFISSKYRPFALSSWSATVHLDKLANKTVQLKINPKVCLIERFITLYFITFSSRLDTVCAKIYVSIRNGNDDNNNNKMKIKKDLNRHKQTLACAIFARREKENEQLNRFVRMLQELQLQFTVPD